MGNSTKTEVAQTRKPIRCLVIQLARLGDTLQSLMALRAAKQLYPELEITFVARERFADAARRIPWIQQVVTLPVDTLVGPLMSGNKTESQTMTEAARWIAPLVKESWDFVVNWSYSEASSYLTGLMPARVKLGYSRRRDASFSSVDGWSHYIQGVVQGGIEQNIHLTDVLTTQLLTALQIHVGDPATDGNSPVTSKSFFALELGDRDLGISWNDFSRKWLAVQLGAGQPEKTWPAESWARLAAYILKRHPECSIVLLGGKEDQDRAKTFLDCLQKAIGNHRQVLSLVGETDFDLWASVVSRCQWLLAGDTAAIHLASVLGTRVLNVSVGPVRWTETGPYGNGHYVVASHLPCAGCSEKNSTVAAHSCRESLTPESVYATWAYAANEWSHRRHTSIENHFRQLKWGDQIPGVRVFRSKIRNTADGGGVVYEPMINHPLEIHSWNGMVMGHIARSWYCGWVPPIGQELTRERISPFLIKQLRELSESADALSKICEEASRIATLLNRRSSDLPSERVMRIRDRDELRNLGTQLMDLDKLVERLAKTHAPLQAFAQMSKVLMHNLKGTHLSDLGRETSINYRQLGEGISILRQWVKHTLNLARPMAVRMESIAPVEKLKIPSGKELTP